MAEKILTKEILDELRKIEGFPFGKDEDIIALSDPPHYTACPNPWIAEFIKEYGKPYNPKSDSYNREPFAADVSEGRSGSIYNAHSYHTKVPHKAIMRYILHYTEPGDIVFDGFCGTGMTGVAAQMCENPDIDSKIQIEKEIPAAKWGLRYALLNDLSPIATFISHNYTKPVDVSSFYDEAEKFLNLVEDECGWVYQTIHCIDGKPVLEKDINGLEKSIIGKINYTIWSDVFLCPNCSKEITFWDSAVDISQSLVREDFPCPHCRAIVSKNPSAEIKSQLLERSIESIYDKTIGEIVQRTKQVPVLINYTILDRNKKEIRFNKKPDDSDITLIKKIFDFHIPYWYPNNKMMFKGSQWGDTWRSGYHLGISYSHQFYTKRNLIVLSSLWNHGQNKSLFKHLIDSYAYTHGTKMTYLYIRDNSIVLTNKNANNLSIPSLSPEKNLITGLRSKLSDIANSLFDTKKFHSSVYIETTDASNVLIPDNSIDYIFTDPPFGGNLIYSEMNFLWESWLKVFTNNKNEAIECKSQKKALSDYQFLMEKCFKEYYRILKPGRWATVEFHNSKNSVWMAIQEALQRAGFVIADVRTLDKQQGTFNQVVSLGAVKQDLIISAYKPNGGLEERFKLIAGTHDGVWDFVRQHLKHLPIVSEKKGVLEVIADRQSYLLFDRMVAFHVQRGVIVPISASDFYTGLTQRFPERDGMYFLEDQVMEYDRKRMAAKHIEQELLYVRDEKDSIRWLRKELREKPDTFQNIQPRFLRELHQYKYEKLPELHKILEENFLQDLQGRWYLPDHKKEADLIKVRERALLKEFEEYKVIKGKLKLFRTEAIKAGFKKYWSDREYATIIAIGERLPSQILHEDDVLLMYYDNALTRQGTGKRGK